MYRLTVELRDVCQDRKEVEYGCTGYRVAVRGMCISGHT